MLSCYKILDVDNNASAEEIKRAYKKLALKYHPDKNGGNKEFEELFKLVNQAYQILSDPEKRQKHDLDIAYALNTNNLYSTDTSARPAYRSREEKTVYNRYGKYDWRNAPRYKAAPVYKIDKNYYRNIGISFIAMFVFAIIAIGIAKYNTYLDEQEQLRKEAEYTRLIKEAENLYDRGEYRLALNLIENQVRNNPIEYRFFEKRDQFIKGLNSLAIEQYTRASYASAVNNLEVLKDFQNPVRLSNWNIMADCYMKLGDLKNAARTYEVILEREHDNVQLMLEVAELHHQLGDTAKELDYYNEARYMFKKFQENAYGSAYEFVIDPSELPETYFNMFRTRANLMYSQNNFEETIKDCNWAIFLRPERAEMYYLRAKARLGLNQPNRACNDIKRAISKGLSKNSVNIKLQCDFF